MTSTTLPCLALLVLLSPLAVGGDVLTQEAFLKATNTGLLDTFGAAVAVEAGRAVVGAPGEASASTNPGDDSALEAGAVYMMSRAPGGAWSHQAYLKAPVPAADAQFGHAVALSGDTLAVGEPNPSGLGRVHVFVESGGVWTLQQSLAPTVLDSGDRFGWSLTLEGDTLVVGALYEASAAPGVNGNAGDNSAPLAGAAYVFRRSAGVWSQDAYLKASNPGSTDFFGSAVALAGDTVIVGAMGESSSATGVGGNEFLDDALFAGACYAFREVGGVWSQEAYLKASNSGSGDQFGAALDLEGDVLVVGARAEASGGAGELDDSAPQAGAVFVFRRSAGAWSQEAYLKATNPGAMDVFGSSVALDGDALIVGAPVEASSAVGLDGDSGDDSAVGAGAAYLYEYDGSAWSPVHYVKAPVAEADDNFGRALDLDGGVLLVGAPGEASSSTGVLGDPLDNLAPFAGAVFALRRFAGDSGLVYCTGVACPCGNPGAAGEGCANGTGRGASLVADGSTSASAAELVLLAEGLPANQPGLFFQGDNAVNGGAGNLFGDGLRCAGGGVKRLEVVAASAQGCARTDVDVAATAGLSGGEVRRYQLWYRDPAGTPCGAGFNLSNGVQLTWSP